MKKFYNLIVVMLCCILISSTSVGCIGNAERTKTFSNSGLNITLTNSFYQLEEASSFTACYESNNALVLILKEDFSSLHYSYRNYNVTQYANLVIQNNNLKNTQVTTHDNYAEFSYENSVSGNDFYYYARCYKTNLSFWLVQFSVFSSQKDEMSSKIQSWANSITFNQGV